MVTRSSRIYEGATTNLEPTPSTSTSGSLPHLPNWLTKSYLRRSFNEVDEKSAGLVESTGGIDCGASEFACFVRWKTERAKELRYDVDGVLTRYRFVDDPP